MKCRVHCELKTHENSSSHELISLPLILGLQGNIFQHLGYMTIMVLTLL